MTSVGLLDWDNFDTLVEIGYETTREKLRYSMDATTLRTVESEAAANVSGEKRALSVEASGLD